MPAAIDWMWPRIGAGSPITLMLTGWPTRRPDSLVSSK
jgi:hypothetical protein